MFCAGMGAPARSTSFAGPITREAGFLGYNEICKVGWHAYHTDQDITTFKKYLLLTVYLQELTTPNSNWTVVWEPCHQAPFMVTSNNF